MVFSTTEVFEGVLLQLELQDLLRVRRVCCHWRDVIVQSPALQQKLFLQPISNKTRQPELNPIIQALFPPFFQLQEVPSRWDFAIAKEIQEQDWFQNEDRRKAVLQPKASWRRMFPVQPPARIGRIVHNEICCLNEEMMDYEKISDKFEYLQQEGARMGLIFDIIVHFLDDFSDPSFFIQWHMFPTFKADENDKSTTLEDVQPSAPEIEGEGKGEELENKITMYAAHDLDRACNHLVLVDSGLRVVDFDPKLLENEEPIVDPYETSDDDEDVED